MPTFPYVPRAAVLALLIFGVLFATACHSDTPYGVPCDDSTDCAGGLTCIPYVSVAGGVCTSEGNVCLATCAATTDCAFLGSNWVCATACSGSPICEPGTPDAGADAEGADAAETSDDAAGDVVTSDAQTD